MVATIELEKIAPSKISTSHQILFIELMSIVRQAKIAQTPFKEIFQNHNRDFNHK